MLSRAQLGRRQEEQKKEQLTCGCVPQGVVAAVVAKGQLEGGAAKGLAQHLVAHADAKHRLLAQDLLCDVNSVRHRRRVALQRMGRRRGTAW